MIIWEHPDDGTLLPRIPFGKNTSEYCVTWYRDYKEAKGKSLSRDKVVELKAKCKALVPKG